MYNGADGRAVQHLDSTATQHSTLIALHRSTISSQSHILSQRWTTPTAVVRADERVAIVAKAEEKWVCGEGGDPLIRPTVEIPKLGPPSNMFMED